MMWRQWGTDPVIDMRIFIYMINHMSMTGIIMSPLVFFKCLADDTRLKSLLLILEHQELCVCDLQQALELSQPKVSRHLSELRKCDLLMDERRGRWVYYRLHPQLPAWATGILQQTAAHHQDYLHDCQQRLVKPSPLCES